LTFGDLSEINLGQTPERTNGIDSNGDKSFVKGKLRELTVGKRVNLDPTALMGLCSDLLHYDLPEDEAGARRRFFRPKEKLIVPLGKRWGKYRKKGLINGDTKPEGVDGVVAGLGRLTVDEDEDQSQNSKELYKNLLEEMDIPLIPEIRDTLEGFGYKAGEVEFWATKDSIRYMKEALGGDAGIDTGEQRRMRRLLGLEDGDFWEGSRYEGKEGVLEGLKVRVFDDAVGQDNGVRNLPTGFHGSLLDITTSFLQAYGDPGHIDSSLLPAFLKPQRMPLPKVAKLSLPFPIVSLGSLRRGAEEGMTTLMMGNIVLREVFGSNQWKVKGWVQGNYKSEEFRTGGGDEGARMAAVWMLPYRSLGEAKRVKFEKGDYSYPQKV